MDTEMPHSSFEGLDGGFRTEIGIKILRRIIWYSLRRVPSLRAVSDETENFDCNFRHVCLKDQIGTSIERAHRIRCSYLYSLDLIGPSPLRSAIWRHSKNSIRIRTRQLIHPFPLSDAKFFHVYLSLRRPLGFRFRNFELERPSGRALTRYLQILYPLCIFWYADFSESI